MQKKIVKMFDSIASKYDKANRILSFGIDKKWRKEAVKEVLKNTQKNKLKILDVACGTGDMIESWLKSGKDIEICGLDASEKMLEIAKKRFPKIKFYHSFATQIPCENNSVDIISVSFGLRNVLEIEKALEEFNRILKKDGKLVILEFIKNDGKNGFRKCVDFYTNKILPNIASIITQNKDAYEYLSKSIENFYTADELSNLLKEKNFKIEEIKLFNFSQVAMIVAIKEK